MHLGQAFEFSPSFQYKDGEYFSYTGLGDMTTDLLAMTTDLLTMTADFLTDIMAVNGPRATSCDTMVAKYDAIKWPSVLISTKTNVVQQRMHLRHAMKSA